MSQRTDGLDPRVSSFVPPPPPNPGGRTANATAPPQNQGGRMANAAPPPSRSRASRPRRGGAGAAFREAERAVSTPRVVRTRSDLLAALAANGTDAFRVKVHLGGCACTRAAAFQEACGDGMLAIPDSRGARVALRVVGEEGDTRQSLEARLKRMLFLDVLVDGVVLRVSCATCLLEAMPNGAVAYIADSEDAALAKMAARPPRAGETPPFVVAAPISLLRRAFAKQAAAKHARASLCAFLGGQERAMLTVTADELKSDHHLGAFLGQNQQHGSRYLVLLASKVQKKWRLELPGGKRRLGETSWDAARRELHDEAGCKLVTATPSEVVDFATMRCFVVDSSDAQRASDGEALAPPPPPAPSNSVPSPLSLARSN